MRNWVNTLGFLYTKVENHRYYIIVNDVIKNTSSYKNIFRTIQVSVQNFFVSLRRLLFGFLFITYDLKKK